MSSFVLLKLVTAAAPKGSGLPQDGTGQAAFKPTGPYTVQHAEYDYSALDITGRKIDAAWPTSAPSGTLFPVIAFAHGFSDQGYSSYSTLFQDLASWGYVVVVPVTCEFGCLGDCVSLPLDPPCFGHYYKQQLLAIDWARSSAASALPINISAGVAVAGHSMGGQASLFSSSYNASAYDIRAAALLHAFSHTAVPISVPFMTFTGERDTTAPPKMAHNIFNATGACPTRALVNRIDANHHEPTSSYNPKMTLYTVAWFKLYLDKTPVSLGNDWEDMIHGNGPTSLCGGGDGDLKECVVLPTRAAAEHS